MMSRNRLGIFISQGGARTPLARLAWEKCSIKLGRWTPLVGLALILSGSPAWAADNASAAAPAAKAEETNSQEVLRSYLQLQEELHATQLAIDKGRQEMAAASERDANAFNERLRNIELSLGNQRARELDALLSANRAMLVTAGVFAGIGFIAMLLMAYFQWRTITRLAEISAALPVMHGFTPAQAVPALGPGTSQLFKSAMVTQSGLRLQGALEELEKRIHELEHTAQQPLPEIHGSGNGVKPNLVSPLEAEPHGNGKVEVDSAKTSPALSGDIAALLLKGQSLLSADQALEALECFNEAVRLEPRNGEALVKKGSALEKLGRLDQATECYDAAIAADPTMTIAYLHKGGLFNRMERFSEALACYEQALHTQERRSN